MLVTGWTGGKYYGSEDFTTLAYDPSTGSQLWAGRFGTLPPAGDYPNAIGTTLGWIHSVDPSGNTYNHAPLDVGDSLDPPDAAHNATTQTWWGFPTWRETMSPNWRDPRWPIHVLNFANTGPNGQPPGLIPPGDTTVVPPASRKGSCGSSCPARRASSR